MAVIDHGMNVDMRDNGNDHAISIHTNYTGDDGVVCCHTMRIHVLDMHV